MEELDSLVSRAVAEFGVLTNVPKTFIVGDSFIAIVNDTMKEVAAWSGESVRRVQAQRNKKLQKTRGHSFISLKLGMKRRWCYVRI